MEKKKEEKKLTSVKKTKEQKGKEKNITKVKKTTTKEKPKKETKVKTPKKTYGEEVKAELKNGQQNKKWQNIVLPYLSLLFYLVYTSMDLMHSSHG